MFRDIYIVMNEMNEMNGMNQYKIMISDRDYSSWSFIDCKTHSEILPTVCPGLETLNPIKDKLFTQDVFSIVNGHDSYQIKSIYSPVKSHQLLAGVLVLADNKTLGRTDNKKRLLYKCLPDDKHLPAFLIPYNIQIGFSKVKTNKYIVFRFDKWTDTHPQGMLMETLGDVDNLEAFYEYQLYCKSLHVSIKDFTNKTVKTLDNKPSEEHIHAIMTNPNFAVEDRRSEYVFTIDPPGSLDFDDGFSIIQRPDGKWTISVYIANVYFWLETLGLWDSFSKRVATIYLPDRRRPMLPTILSDALCSLQQNQPRFAFVMDVVVDNDGTLCSECPIEYKNALIKVSKNYAYEESRMINGDTKYKQLFDLSTKMDRSIKNSHDLVSQWMIFMNTKCGVEMYSRKIGIFRSAAFTKPVDNNNNNNNNLHDETQRIIQSWNNTSGQYVLYEEGIQINHEIMDTQSYIHITSPIRRLVDLLNQMMMFIDLKLIGQISPSAKSFMDNWTGQMEYLNTSMRSIRKIQTDCFVLHRCFGEPDIMNQMHEGVVFDKMVKNDGTISCMVYLEKLKMLSRINIRQPSTVSNYERVQCKLFLFESEDKTTKKIRLQLE
jgi:exoribonuclease R